MKTARTDVKEMAIKQLEEKIAHLQATTVSRDKYNSMKIDFEDAECERVRNFEEYRKMEEAYHKEHSIVINLDAELENVREMLRDVRRDYVKAAKENEHLWGLLKIKMEG
jgi:ASC-1-like (ASCH) protein